jgi:hypothetical protein
MLESVCFQMSEAFIEGYRAGGVGLWGLLFPILVGVLYPFHLVLALRLSRQLWGAIFIFALTILLEYIAIGLAAAGFAILQPHSVIEEFVRENPQSTIAMARAFANLTGEGGLIGFKQAWTIWLTAIPLALIAALHFVPWVRRQPLAVAPIFSASLVIVSYIWYQFVPLLQSYPITLWDVLLGAALAAAGGLLCGWGGLALAKKFDPIPNG